MKCEGDCHVTQAHMPFYCKTMTGIFIIISIIVVHIFNPQHACARLNYWSYLVCLCVCIESSIWQLTVQDLMMALVMALVLLKIQFKSGFFCKTATLPSYSNFVDAVYLLWLSAICLCVSSACMYITLIM